MAVKQGDVSVNKAIHPLLVQDGLVDTFSWGSRPNAQFVSATLGHHLYNIAAADFLITTAALLTP